MTIPPPTAGPFMGRPHMVMLGAGASLAAFPAGDRNGRGLPLMDNIVEVVGLEPILREADIKHRGQNFEQLYSALVSDEKHREHVRRLERAVFDYFDQLEVPDGPGLYDHLALSLRPKDLIATFNWDPFLFQALHRVNRFTRPPQAIWLHGNVALGYCLAHRPATLAVRGADCTRCGARLTPSRLLYPVAVKDYNTDPFLSLSWTGVQRYLQAAYVFTVFGYSAPVSDIEAIKLMTTGWGDPTKRNLEEIEIIDIKTTDELESTWQPFIRTHHYRTTADFYRSLIGSYPRRSCEAVWNGLMEFQWPEPRAIPREASWEELLDWYRPLVDEETEYEARRQTEGQRAEDRTDE